MPPTTVTFMRRAVSPVRFESLEADPDDILCPGSDAEQTPQERRIKRRRVEKAAQEYLRGRGLYVASARLRGPFPDHWRNPYVTEKKRGGVSANVAQSTPQWPPSLHERGQDVALQVQESGVQGGKPNPEAKRDMQTVRDIGHTPESRNIRPTIQEDAKVTQDSFVTATSEPSAKARSVKAAKDSISSSEARGWLRTDGLSARHQFREGSRSPSPTPASRPRRSSPKQLHSERFEAVTKRRDHNKRSTGPDVEEDHTKLPRSTSVLGPVSKPEVSTTGQDENPSRRKLPPSTNLSGFEYRYAPRNASKSADGKPVKSELEVAKKRARAEKKKRLSFTASGNVKKRSPHASSRGSQPPQLDRSGMTEEARTLDENRDSRPGLPADGCSTSNQVGALPEAQIVAQAGLNNDRSVPSVDLLETEKQSLKFRSTDEGDLYHELSTQAAMLQAQRSLQHDIDSPVALQGNHRRNLHHATTDYGEPKFRSEDDGKPAGSSRRGRALGPPVVDDDDDEPMNTQAMFDAVSPFVLTTVKKRAPDERQFDLVGSIGSSPPQSPTGHDFRVTSLSMSTSPSESPCPANNEPAMPLSALSKPTSTITSFSIAPNGSMTEVLQFDGQQQQQQHYNMGDSDLDAALEEAGSFLGDWSVEKEAKRFERATAGSRNSTT
ncbi:MAG: hypothetical protein Q9216_001320 [Gyalolechia sp. 2 TL-2023]